MIAVVAHEDDESAAMLASRLGYAAAVLTPAGLSRAGWQLDPCHPETGRAVIGDEQVANAEIDGVVTLLPGVSAGDLPQIAAEDREYVAAEMTAFLRAWLWGLRCPMLNRPTVQSLRGPEWTAERWALTASAQRVPVWPLHRRSGDTAEGTVPRPGFDSTITVGVIGDQYIGERSDELRAHVRRLSIASGATTLTASFSTMNGHTALSYVTPFVEPAEPAVCDAVCRHFEGGPR